MAEQHKKQQVTAGSNVPVPQSSMSNDNDELTIDLLELMYHLLDHWKFIVSLALVGAIIATLWTFLLVTPKYQASSTIYVLSRKDSAINMSDLQIGSALTKDYIKVFDMWEVHEEVISNLDLPYTYNEMRSMLTISNADGTRMLEIKFTSTSAEEAARVANEYAAVASQYIADTMATDKPNIMSVALTPTRPVSPNKKRNIAIGFLLGALIAAAIVTVRFIMDDKFKTAEDIRKYTGLTTLAIVPVENSNDKKARKAARSRRE